MDSSEMKSEETAPSLKEDQLLRDWFAGQSNWRTWRALSDALPLPYSSLKKYVHGRPIRLPEHRAKIYRVTGIEAFRPDRSGELREVRTAPPGGEESNKTRLAIQLRQWLSQETRFHSIADMARSIGIAESTLREYFIGRALPSPKNIRKLKEITKLDLLDDILKRAPSRRGETPKAGIAQDLECFATHLGTIKRSVASLAEEFDSLAKDLGRRSEAHSREEVDQTPAGRSRSITELLARLRGELEFFKVGSPEDREVLRKVTPGEQVGYVVSLLKALYDEGAFREWLHFSQLDLTEKR
jgi:transcriptional regulator with XRE-family HTH domain